MGTCRAANPLPSDHGFSAPSPALPSRIPGDSDCTANKTHFLKAANCRCWERQNANPSGTAACGGIPPPPLPSEVREGRRAGRWAGGERPPPRSALCSRRRRRSSPRVEEICPGIQQDFPVYPAPVAPAGATAGARALGRGKEDGGWDVGGVGGRTGEDGGGGRGGCEHLLQRSVRRVGSACNGGESRKSSNLL